MNHPESQSQQALIRWARMQAIPASPDVEPGAKVADYLYAIGNGGKRSRIEAAIMQGEGVKAGVHDLHLPLARSGAFGLWIEMKAGKGKLTDDQAAWRTRMIMAGHQCVTCWDWESAANHIKEYLGC